MADPPPPLVVLPGEEANSSAALAALAKKQSWFARFKNKNRRASKHARTDADDDNEPDESLRTTALASQMPLTPGNDAPAWPGSDSIMHSASMPDDNKDVYEWASVYENERGFTALSTLYYSSSLLLPFDPPAFTIPDAHASFKAYHRAHPDASRRNLASLAAYTLPDPSWTWVSKFWMVDMRPNGEVDYNGWEYNFLFRKRGWKPAGGVVRRRRWVRLMMRPAAPRAEDAANPAPAMPAPDDGDARVWRGDAQDWTRCAAAMRRLARDGRKLEVWRAWLGQDARAKEAARRQWTEDGGVQPPAILLPDIDAAHGIDISAPPPEWITSVLEEHGHEVLHLFIYPDSRAEFLDMVDAAGLRDRLGKQLFAARDFWSRAVPPESRMSEIMRAPPATEGLSVAKTA